MFLDLHLSIVDEFLSCKIYDKHDDFDFEIVNFPFLDGDVPRAASYGVYISQLIRFARVSSHVTDFNTRNIETNPGPDSVDSSGSSSENLSATSFELLHNHLSITDVNVQSLAPKIDTIRSEAEPYDVLVFSESWLNPDIVNSTIQI